MSELGQRELVRKLPAVDKLLNEPAIIELENRIPRSIVTNAVRDTIESLRMRILAGDPPGCEEMAVDRIAEAARDLALSYSKLSIRRVINATGIVLHTGLGRAVLSEAARNAVETVSAGHCNLEIDLETGVRGSRGDHYRKLLADLCGTESAMAVNNNAAAVLLALNTLANGKEVIVSRGQLVEIGGSFRLPDIMASSGAQLVEVGTTNRTRVSDYERAISDRTALILRVHPSNFKIIGFREETPLKDLVELGSRYSIPVVDDIGSGALVDMSRFGLNGEPLVQESVKAGSDLVLFSGDKLLGGPQAGLIVGSKEIIELMTANPLTRCLRIDKLTVAMLESTLKLYNDPDRLFETNPTIKAIARPIEDIDKAARKLKRMLSRIANERLCVEILDGYSEVGGGSLPGERLPTKLAALSIGDMNAMDAAKAFRQSEPPIFGRISNDRFLLDLRTISNQDMQDIIQATYKILNNLSPVTSCADCR